jgi:hypothetical protein
MIYTQTVSGGTSFCKLHASKVQELAQKSGDFLRAERKEWEQRAIEISTNDVSSHVFGLYKRLKYPTPELVLKSKIVREAQELMSNELYVCDMLSVMAHVLLDDEDLPDEEKVIHVSLDDFRSLLGEGPLVPVENHNDHRSFLGY